MQVQQRTGRLGGAGVRDGEAVTPQRPGDVETAIPRFEDGTVSVDLGQIMNNSDRRRGPKPVKCEKLATWLFDYLSQDPHPFPSVESTKRPKRLSQKAPHPFGTKGYDGKG